MDLKDDIKTIHQVYSRLSMNGSVGETAVQLHETFNYPNFPDDGQGPPQLPKGTQFQKQTPGFPLLKAEQLPGWEVTLSKTCKAVNMAELCFVTDYENEFGSIQTFL